MPGRGWSQFLSHSLLLPSDVAQGAVPRQHMRALPLAAASPAKERAISLSLPRSNGASQSGDTIIASTIQFPLSIIYCIFCTRRRRRWLNRFLSESTLRTAGQSRARRFAWDSRAPRSPLSPPAGADAARGPAVGLSLGPGLGRAASGPLGDWAPAGGLQKVTSVKLPAAFINKQCLLLSWLHS